MGRSPVVNPATPAMEEPPAAGLTSLGGVAYDEGDPASMSGDVEAWAMVGMANDSARGGTKTTGHAPSSAAQDPPEAVEHAMLVVS